MKSVFKSLKRLSMDTLIYGLGTVLQAFIGFLLFPIYTRILSQADFGIQDLLSTFSIMVSFIFTMGLDSGAARYYYDTTGEEGRKLYLSSWLWWEVVISIPLVILMLFFARPICGVIFNNPNLASPFRLLISAIPFILTIKVANITLRLTFRAKTFTLLTSFGLLTQALSAILFVVVFKLGISGVFLAILCANIIQASAGIVFTARNFVFRFSWPHMKSMLAFGLPLVPATISIWVLTYSNRFFLSKWTSLEEIAIYGAAYRINALVSLGITAFQNAWPPFAFSLLQDESHAKMVYKRTLTYFIVAVMFACVVLSLFAREALLVLATSKYEKAYQLVPLLLLGTISWGTVQIVAIACEIHKKSYQITIATILGAFVTIMLSIGIIPNWGLIGAAIATMLGNVIALIYIYYVGQKYFFVDYELKRILRGLVLAGLVIASGNFLDHTQSKWLPMLLLPKVGLVLLYLIGYVMLRILTKDEIRSASSAIRTFVAEKIGRGRIQE